MLRTSTCFKRWCLHYVGIAQPDGTEASEVAVCDAFPQGIPDDIAYGDNKHMTPYKGQENDIVYEKGGK
jgi:hypothetical protein